MASTTALFTGLSGLNAHARKIDVIGNNIANVSTTAYKSARLVFSDMLSKNLDQGQPPGESSGGTNPAQIGLGVSIAGTQRDFTPGTVSATGNPRDMAIDGNGFFAVLRGDEQFYTRAGEFVFDENNALVTLEGDRLLGLAADENFAIQPGALSAINIPIGELTIAEATTRVRMAGNLNADGDIAQSGTTIRLGGTDTSGLSLIAGATVPPAAGNVLEAASLLTEIEDPDDPGSGTPLFADGQILELNGARKGGGTLPTAQLAIDLATTVQDLMDFLAGALGIQATGAANPDGNTPGVTLDPTTGELTVVGNTGTASAIELENADLRLLDSDGTLAGIPLLATTTGEASGESVRTGFVVFDSLGSPVEVELTMTLVGKGDTGTTWRYDIESADDSDVDLGIATGELEFDPFGRLAAGGPVGVTIDREGTGAVSPLAFDLTFAESGDEVTALADTGSQLAAVFRDGAAIGVLEDFSVARDGTVFGSFSNTLIKPLAQLQLATFTNPAGVEDLGNNLYRPTGNSGQPVVVSPGEFGAGSIVGGALELSNVDLGREFIELILTSTGYSASSRVIRTTDELMQELLTLGR